MIDSRDRPEIEIQHLGKRGVYCPEGMSAADIMAIAEILEDRQGVEPYTSRSLAREIIAALRARGSLA